MYSLPKSPTLPSVEARLSLSKRNDSSMMEAQSADGLTDIPDRRKKGRFIIVFMSILMCLFLFALDQLIVTTATPNVISAFDSLKQVSWLFNGFYLTMAGSTLMFGQMLAVFPSKVILLSAVFVLEIGSLVCGIAPNMAVLIVGRAITGLGGAGIYSAAYQITVEITTLAERPMYLALFGACFGLASVMGPMVGGVLTDHVSWRWCFYINLPIGVVASGLIFVLLERSSALGGRDDSRSVWRKIVQLDWVGTSICVGHTASISLAFQYGGIEYVWTNPRVIVLLAFIPLTCVLLCVWTIYIRPDRAMFDIQFLKRRAIMGASLIAFFGWATFMTVVCFLVIIYQTVYGDSATRSGVDLLSMVGVLITLLLIVGRIVAKTGHYKYIVCAGPIPVMIGCGLLYWAMDSGVSLRIIIGYQVLIGAGTAAYIQNTIIAGQVEFRDEPGLISRAVGLITFFGFIGRIIGVSVSTSIFINLIPNKVEEFAPELPASLIPIVREGFAGIRTVIPKEYQAGIIIAYRKSIAPVFFFAGAASVLCFCSTWLLKNSSLNAPAQEVIDSNHDDTHLELNHVSYRISSLYISNNNSENNAETSSTKQKR
ncbi:Predicted transporter (major facilitator superfamily) [Phaffia rhodozyma]|uniref:Predicted transporter (Major facilitator superfamily) n=1 Tax=Phaffia rhodozyma TaxID=264483 RepID=A0A0F7SHD5_PHARH|nr:Predicted transporter (major facilitator superfamily) [Phaffia rhodozyma]